ncbi:hypothetical protein MJO28_003822, partial [Puccinia striiformis f. sp. tritici]
RAVQIPSS